MKHPYGFNGKLQMENAILLSGSGGLIGHELCGSLMRDKIPVHQLVRHPVHAQTRNVAWDIDAGKIEAEKCEGHKAVVHLAGEPIAAKKWTPEQKQRIRDSRVNGTRLLAETLAGLNEKPEVFVCASAIGYYGSRGNETLTEASEAGEGFLAEVTLDWEAAAQPARDAGIRVVHARFGIVLATGGGALAKMLPAFKMGVGGRLGDGSAWMSWIALPDVIGGIRHILDTPDLSGPVNFTAPEPVTNYTFTKALGHALHRPTILPVPQKAIATVFGEMGETLLLNSAKVLPETLQSTGYTFKHPRLAEAFEAIL
jgi:uncharacterized protein (TIGR01777 family)